MLTSANALSRSGVCYIELITPTMARDLEFLALKRSLAQYARMAKRVVDRIMTDITAKKIGKKAIEHDREEVYTDSDQVETSQPARTSYREWHKGHRRQKST